MVGARGGFRSLKERRPERLPAPEATEGASGHDPVLRTRHSLRALGRAEYASRSIASMLLFKPQCNLLNAFGTGTAPQVNRWDCINIFPGLKAGDFQEG